MSDYKCNWHNSPEIYATRPRLRIKHFRFCARGLSKKKSYYEFKMYIRWPFLLLSPYASGNVKVKTVLMTFELIHVRWDPFLRVRRLTNKLLELCNKPTGSIHPLSINTHFKSLKRLVEDSSFSKVSQVDARPDFAHERARDWGAVVNNACFRWTDI